jgi:hypothetical protein
VLVLLLLSYSDYPLTAYAHSVQFACEKGKRLIWSAMAGIGRGNKRECGGSLSGARISSFQGNIHRV